MEMENLKQKGRIGKKILDEIIKVILIRFQSSANRVSTYEVSWITSTKPQNCPSLSVIGKI